MTRSPGRQPKWTRTQNLASQLLEDDYLKHLLVPITQAISKVSTTAFMNTFVFTASSSNSYSSYNLPGDVVHHLVHLPVPHLLHLLFQQHLFIIQHLPNRQQPLPTLLSPPTSDLTLNSTPHHILVHLGDLTGDLVLHLLHTHVHHLLHNINHFQNNLQNQYYHHRQQL